MKLVSVARTMAEQGEICPDCNHPWGRHDTEGGCVAGHRHPARRKPIVCACPARPTRRAPTPAPVPA